jgi:putative transposase
MMAAGDWCATGICPSARAMTGIGAVDVQCPRVRDRVGEGGEHIRFSSTILPPYARRSKSLALLWQINGLVSFAAEDFAL